jgi:general secretion pathway protein D
MQLQRNPDVEPTIDELVRDYMGAIPPVAPQPGDMTVQPPAGAAAPAQVIEPTVKQSSGVVRPIEVPASEGKR